MTTQKIVNLKKVFKDTYKETKTYREGIIKMLISSGSKGLTINAILNITGQSSPKSVRQTIRKARWELFERGYRLVKDVERTDQNQVVYKAVKVIKGIKITKIFQQQSVVGYSLKKAA